MLGGGSVGRGGIGTSLMGPGVVTRGGIASGAGLRDSDDSDAAALAGTGIPISSAKTIATRFIGSRIPDARHDPQPESTTAQHRREGSNGPFDPC